MCVIIIGEVGLNGRNEPFTFLIDMSVQKKSMVLVLKITLAFDPEVLRSVEYAKNARVSNHEHNVSRDATLAPMCL